MKDLLHYYCSPTVFHSIATRSELWLTSLTASNDHAEGQWMLNHWLSRFKKEDRTTQLGARTVVENAMRSYCALGTCFSEEADLLSQWRGYASNGAGFSISFKVDQLEKIAKHYNEGPQLQLSKISYGNRDLEQINEVVRDLAENFLEDAKQFKLAGDSTIAANLHFPDGKHDRQRQSAKRLFTAKNGSFFEEKEWRLFLFESPSKIPALEYREAQGMISPFLRLTIPPESISSVRLGPSNENSTFVIEQALLHKSAERRGSPFPGRTYPTASVTGMPSAV